MTKSRRGNSVGNSISDLWRFGNRDAFSCLAAVLIRASVDFGAKNPDIGNKQVAGARGSTETNLFTQYPNVI